MRTDPNRTWVQIPAWFPPNILVPTCPKAEPQLHGSNPGLVPTQCFWSPPARELAPRETWGSKPSPAGRKIGGVLIILSHLDASPELPEASQRKKSLHPGHTPKFGVRGFCLFLAVPTSEGANLVGTAGFFLF